MLITYERVYYADRVSTAGDAVPVQVRAGAESQIAYLLPTRAHVLTTRDGRAFSRAALASSEGWIVTYTPEAPHAV